MRKLTLICCLLLGSATTAVADDTLTLTIDAASGAAWMENLSGGDVVFDAYLITSASSALDPVGWFSFEDRILADSAAAQAVLGDLGWMELAATTDILGDATFGLGTTAAPGFSVPMGTLFSSVDLADITFTLNDTYGRTLGQTSFPGEIRIVPEPSTLGLALLGAAAAGCLLRRRK